ncbi:methionine synthase [Candidatus Poribacteria bacterium]|nr:methionine synthase [Candidatus Poribacteria bacterium]
MTTPDIERLFRERIVVLDGAMGTSIQQRRLSAEDYGGAQFEGCEDYVSVTRPGVIADIHAEHLDAGADIVETNTFGASATVLAEYGLEGEVAAVNLAAAEVARAAADAASTASRPRLVIGSMGPGTKSISVTGGITWEEARDVYYEQALALLRGGVDLLLLETAQDTLNAKAAITGIRAALDDAESDTPVMLSGTIELMGATLAGQTVEALAAAVEHLPLFSIGLNCSTGPTFMTDHIRALAGMAKTRVTCVPNAGLPDENGDYSESPKAMARVLARFAENGWLNAIGGCCGTTPAHVRAFAEVAAAYAPREAADYARTQVSGLDLLTVEDDGRPYFVGERTNVLGSRKFRRLIERGKYDEAAEIARRQVRGGAHVIDVCLQDPDRDEAEDVRRFYDRLVRKIKLPIMVDSTDATVIEQALKYCQGKAIINSINLEDGEERFARVVPLAKTYGAALVVGVIDEDPDQGMGVTVERKLAIADRSYALLTGKYGVAEEDIIWDPLVFPVGTGDATYMEAGAQTVEGVRALKARYPNTKTVLGISNVSFGLPPAGREVLNSVFLYHCTRAGLDLAIVNTERLERYASIPDDEKTLAERLLFDNSDAAIQEFADHFRDRKAAVAADEWAGLTLDERLARYIVEGTRDGLAADLDIALSDRAPLDIVNGPLMAGMDEVGRLFNANELIVAEVLQSAEAMKAAVAHLEPHMDSTAGQDRGAVLLATVKGDVHDIGKNLVDIILTNNGYRVVNLGIKIAPETLIQAHDEHRPDIIGLSGLLVKSAQQMVTTVEDLAARGVSAPVLVGGAALSAKFAASRIAPAYTTGGVAYARDAMDGLRLANALMAGEAVVATPDHAAAGASERGQAAPLAAAPTVTRRSSRAPVQRDVPTPPDYARHIIEGDADALFEWIDPQLLYGRGLGFRGSFAKALAAGDGKAVELERSVREVRARAAEESWLAPRAVYQFYECAASGNEITVMARDGSGAVEEFPFPRQSTEDGLCLADYVASEGSDVVDNVCMFVTTAGASVRETAELLKDRGEYVASHALSALAYELAEALAESLHGQIRAMWGFADPAGSTRRRLMRGEYRGKRYSFGYPACPDMRAHEGMWRLLRPEDIGVELTESHMMDPEASVSALVFHHPDAQYFDTKSRA